MLISKSRLFRILVCVNVIYVIFYVSMIRYNRYQKQNVFSSHRVFIFTSDDRPITKDQNTFYKLSVLINCVYAHRYNYTYRYFHINYNHSRNVMMGNSLKPRCFNQVLNQERSAHWAKLQVIWHVLETYSSSYDLFLYLDSDAVINNHNLSIPTLLSHLSWVKPSKCKDFHINSCHVAFTYDTWNKTDTFVVPNSGMFLFQPTIQFRQFLQLWWHLNMHESNFYGFYEQDSLWNLLEDIPSPAARTPTSDELIARQPWNTKIKDILHQQHLTKRVGILDMTTFGYKKQSQFLVHSTSGIGADHRQPQLLSIWQRIQATLNYTLPFIEVEKQCAVQFDTTNDRIPSNLSV